MDWNFHNVTNIKYNQPAHYQIQKQGQPFILSCKEDFQNSPKHRYAPNNPKEAILHVFH